jgi:ribosomal protein S18 acetylase RimI-like enzyme
MIRPVAAADIPTLLDLTHATGVFKPHEIDALKEVLHDYFAHNLQADHVAVIAEKDGVIQGYAYYAPAAMTDRTWYLYWIAVRSDIQARGVGTKLLLHTEEDIRRRNGRVLFIETSSLPHYDKTRSFYLKNGYEVTGTLRDYYCDGDDMVVFRKRLQG